MNTDRGGRSLTKGLANVIVAGAVSVAGMAGLSAPASAQFWGGGWFGPIPIPGPAPADSGAAIPVRMVARIVAAQGFRLTDYPVRRGNRVIALGVDGRGQMMRFVIDAYDGAVLRASLVGAPRPPGYIGNPDTYAYGAPAYGVPEAREPLEAAPKPKAKPKVKTAAKPPATLPHAAPASPATPPSQATHAPAPVTPSAPVTAPATVSTPPVAPAPPAAATSTPPAPAAPAAPAVVAPVPATPVAPPVAVAPPPDVRPAPDAQPSADIGPKVVPVKPTEAKAPEPDSWDTEAQPKTPNVTPDQANTMPPERHEDK